MRDLRTLKIGFILDLHGKVNNPIARLDNYMQAILDKVEFILKHNDIIVFCGDIFHNYLTGIIFINKLLLLISRYEALGKIIKIIPGNHDLIGRRYDSWTETSLGTLAIGRDWLLTDIFSTRAFRIVPLTFEEDGTPVIPKFNKQDDCYNILVGHAYFNHPEYNDKWNISEEVTEGFQICVLGHDHQEYPWEELKTGCFLLRSGSISRLTVEDKDREPKYPQVIIETSRGVWENGDFFYAKIPHNSASEVFKEPDISQEITQHKKNIQRMVELLQVEDRDSKDYSLDEALVELKCPTKYKDIIREVLHE